MAEVIEQLVVFQHIVVHAAGSRNLVGKPPADDGRVVVILGDKLLHLGKRVGAGFGHMLGNIGDLRPCHKTVFVAQVIEILRVLVVRQAHRVGTHVADDLHILLMLGRGEGIAKPCAVLMARRSDQTDGFTVEPKAAVGAELDFAAAEPHGHGVPTRQGHRRMVQIGVSHAVPQVNRVQREHGYRLAALHGSSLFTDTLHGEQHLGAVGCVFAECLDGDFGADEVICNFGCHAQGGRTVVVQRKMAVGHNQHIYIAVDTAVKCKVGFLRVNRAVGAVVNRDC